ncbi:TetR/AcrR family transcriptional regulator [Mycobacterium sp. DL99]|uniref:TetR/AcrR family transcriptional regulator n=1 Tax=Mycobacterium sp. DL99 TaxID=2528957 RepID=UPI00256FD4A8|nr:TetR/AcrR family transcriptional regulator [Mycobacterium sp. DL99]
MGDQSDATPKRRLSKQDRHTQLLDAARELIREAGTEQFTLGRLAERAGVTKPVVYDHFGDKAGVLAELYREFEERQREMLDAALAGAGREARAVARVIADAYIDCCLAQGRELADVVAALAGSPTLSRLRQEAEDAYLATCREALAPFPGRIDATGLSAVIGAGDALARDALADRISPANARNTLARVITAIATDDQNDTKQVTS